MFMLGEGGGGGVGERWLSICICNKHKWSHTHALIHTCCSTLAHLTQTLVYTTHTHRHKFTQWNLYKEIHEM